MEQSDNCDVRWIQRLEHYDKAFALHKEILDSVQNPNSLSNMEKLSVVKSFEIVFELSWNVMKDYLLSQNITDIAGSRDAIRHSFKIGLIANGQVWIDMIGSRNKTAHIYNESTANELVDLIFREYYNEFVAFSKKMNCKLK